MSRTLVLVLAFSCAFAVAADAQPRTREPRPPRAPRAPRTRNAGPPRPGPERLRIVVDGGAQIASGSFGQNFALTTNAEAMPITTDLSLATAGFFDVGARVRVSRTLSVGGVFFVAPGSASGTIDAKVPHPFYFNQFRDVSGSLDSLEHAESGAHFELAYPVSITRNREITIFGGPSFIRTKQSLATAVVYSESYPYDTATLTSATTTKASAGALGFNVGADATWRVGRSVRAGAMLRYSRANTTLSAAPGNDVTLHAGGLQVGAGLRFLIQTRPRTPGQPARPRRP